MAGDSKTTMMLMVGMACCCVVAIVVAILLFVASKKGWFGGAGDDDTDANILRAANMKAAPGPADEAEIHYENGNIKKVRYDENRWKLPDGWESVGDENKGDKAGGIKKVWIPEGKLLCLKEYKEGPKKDPKAEVGTGPKWLPDEYNYDIPMRNSAEATWLRNAGHPGGCI